MNSRPHIVIFNPDQFRGDVLGHMGNPAAATPVLDDLAATEAVSFSRAFCQNTVCTPSRCSFMTGWYPHVRGHRTMYHMLHPERGEPALLAKLKESGYHVWWGGKNDLIPGQMKDQSFARDVRYRPDPPVHPAANLHGCKDWRGEPGGDNWYSFHAGRLDPPDGEYRWRDRDWAMIEGAIEHIRTAPDDQPLCIYLPINYPHPPYGVEEPFYSMVAPDEIPARQPSPDWSTKPSILGGIAGRQGLQNWSEDRWRRLRATYYGQCARVDHQLGLLIQAMRERGMWDDTALFFFSDHGDFTGDYGLVEKTQNTFEDCLSRVPLLIKPPAGVEVRPGVRDALVELVDFPATVYELTGIEPGYTHFGRSLLDVVAGRADEHRDAVFCEGGRLHGETHCMELESTSSQSPDGLYWPRVNLQQSEGPEHTKAVMCRTGRYKYVRRLYESDEFYDLVEDPGEMHNRIDDPALAEVRAQLSDRMLTFFLETGDVVPFETDRRH
jgi:arylsulfatase A-like enzyme